jgi:hypothetical protein
MRRQLTKQANETINHLDKALEDFGNKVGGVAGAETPTPPNLLTFKPAPAMSERELNRLIDWLWVLGENNRPEAFSVVLQVLLGERLRITIPPKVFAKDYFSPGRGRPSKGHGAEAAQKRRQGKSWGKVAKESSGRKPASNAADRRGAADSARHAAKYEETGRKLALTAEDAEIRDRVYHMLGIVDAAAVEREETGDE